MAYFAKNKGSGSPFQSLFGGAPKTLPGPVVNQAGAPKSGLAAGKTVTGARRTVNLDEFLARNQVAGQQMASQVAAKVQTQGQQAQQARQKVESDFAAKVQAATPKAFKPGDINAQNSWAQPASPGSVGQAERNLYLDKQAAKKYDGPTDVSQADGYSDAQTLTQKAAQAANQDLTGVAANNYGAQGNYTTGQNILDAFLLQQGAHRLDSLKQQYGEASMADVDRRSAGAVSDARTLTDASNAEAKKMQDYLNNYDQDLAALDQEYGDLFSQWNDLVKRGGRDTDEGRRMKARLDEIERKRREMGRYNDRPRYRDYPGQAKSDNTSSPSGSNYGPAGTIN